MIRKLVRLRAEEYSNGRPTPIYSYQSIVEAIEKIQIQRAGAFSSNPESFSNFLQVFEIVKETFKLEHRCRERKTQPSGPPRAPRMLRKNQRAFKPS